MTMRMISNPTHPTNDMIERTSIVAYSLFRELHEALADPRTADDVTLGIVMGLAMFIDDKIGPIRAKRLLESVPGIILKTDVYVPVQQHNRFLPVLHAMGEHLQKFQPISEEVEA